MTIAVLDAATLGADIDLSPLAALGELIIYPTTAPNEVAKRLTGVQVAVVNKVRLDDTTLPDDGALKLICVAATGYDAIDTAICRRRGIALYNVPAYSTDSVAQLTLAMALSLATHLKEFRDYTDSGRYTASGVANGLSPVFHELAGQTWGVVGGGNIATKVAEVAKAMGCRVLMYHRSPDDRYQQVSLNTLLEQSDVVSLHVPLTEETRHLIGKAALARMKPTALLINVARGAVTDEEAVAAAVETGMIGGVGIDVYSEEPFGEQHPIFRLRGRDNVCLTPHMAWGSAEARRRCVEVMAQNITDHFADSPTGKNRIV